MKINIFGLNSQTETKRNEINPSPRAPRKNMEEQKTNLNNTPAAFYGQGEIYVRQSDLIRYPKHKQDNYKACLLGGAIGDALGNPVEFLDLSSIKRMYGEEGITELNIIDGKAQITDDTQMTIFTADGLIKSALNGFDSNENPDMETVYNSYQDWLDTQYCCHKPKEGWIANIDELYASRAPGLTCTGSLERKIPGSIEEPVNTSKGCGGVMRVAPVGLKYYQNPEKAFEVGARCAALTHGSPDAYLPAGIHACIVANIVQGKDIETAVDDAIEILKTYDDHENVLELMEKARKYAHSDIDNETAIRELGEGWHGDEAIAISTYCVLKSPNDFREAVIMSVNHDGDSDSTGSIVGNILGAYLGEDKIPEDWKNSIELAKELKQIAVDLYLKPSDIEKPKERYPIR